ncbi:polysaccharide deacetylase family protein [Roseimicrobium sp. ORNL1]|uniref:polysaccharide deacetylase family protein n=1 Tax=Roseimicrobium sp. ORNL1 TaxID=2711231 RepID=UPI0013E17F13|nr:polysaccharide deacetylase family protein [Roseimicrobium sp. ORNL1]QIF02618.1 polysaccharide deacetylase family protein [Roseimicrobium sp. ORNL1]
MKRRPPSLFHLATLLALAGLLMLAPSCEKLKELLPKQPPKQEAPPAPVENPLTAEEEQLQKGMEGDNVFSAKVDFGEVPKALPFELNRSSVVSILLYHDFVERIPRNEMMVSKGVFRAQMQALKDANIPVIPMSDLLAWKKGEKNIPEAAVVITLDDGWVGVHEIAYPILKEFGYPFTLYLYKKYVGGAGRSMTVAQIKEMLANGGELGSHSVSHQAMAQMRRSKSPEQYQAWLHEEIHESKRWLEETFQLPCRTFAYPYGDKNADIVKQVMEAGYDAAVTVNPQKLNWDTHSGELPRFTQLGDQDANFRVATNFYGGGKSISDSRFVKTDAVNEQGEKLVTLKPEPNTTITDRLPVIEANLSKLGPIIPESLVLKVGGFGTVLARYDPATQVVSFRMPQKIRLETCNVMLSFRRVGADKDELVSWQFKVDKKAAYLPQQAAEAAPAPSPAPPASPKA